MSSVFDDPHIQDYLARRREIDTLHAQQEQAHAQREQAHEAKRKNDLLEKILEQMENLNKRIVVLEGDQSPKNSQ